MKLTYAVIISYGRNLIKTISKAPVLFDREVIHLVWFSAKAPIILLTSKAFVLPKCMDQQGY